MEKRDFKSFKIEQFSNFLPQRSHISLVSFNLISVIFPFFPGRKFDSDSGYPIRLHHPLRTTNNSFLHGHLHNDKMPGDMFTYMKKVIICIKIMYSSTCYFNALFCGKKFNAFRVWLHYQFQVLGPESSAPKTPRTRVRRVRTQAEIESKTNAVRQRYNLGETNRPNKYRNTKSNDDGQTLGKLKETLSTGFQQATESGKQN